MDNHEEVVWVYMTAGTIDEARDIGRALVEEHLAACVNIFGPIESIYRWGGAVQLDPEIAFVAKTAHQNLTALTERVKALHSYDTPCVVALPVVGGCPDFLRWVCREG